MVVAPKTIEIVTRDAILRGPPRGRVSGFTRLYAAYQQSKFSFLFVSIPCGFMAKTLENKGFSCPKNVQKKLKKMLTPT
jgi:hypothetical protein